ncbi:MAG: hypothetical protein HQK94_09190 [Nitrospirae bacterium]|nr:hypothetical protein [Nitrospirota bacterium]
MSSNKNLASKRKVFLLLSEDIDSVIQSSLRNDFRGITEIKGYRSANNLSRALETHSPSLIIIDAVLVESLTDFIRKVNESKPSYKMLLILPSYYTEEDMGDLLNYSHIILDLIKRPFTLNRLYTYLKDRFNFTKPKVLTVSFISTDALSHGMILAEDVYIQGSTEPLLECGTVLDEESLKELIKNKIKHIKVNEDTSKFMNCWEVKKCDCLGECPASFFVEADGFLGGINAGRACIYLKYTTGPCVGIYKSIAEKIKLMCSRCEFYKMLLQDNIDKTSLSDLVNHTKKQKKSAETPSE